MLDLPFFKDNNAFVPYEAHHFGALAFFFIFAFVLILFSKRLATRQQQIRIGNFYALFLSTVVIVWTLIKVIKGEFDVKTDLPFHLCNLIALLIPIYAFTRKKILYEILLFWVFSGTIQALFTPDLSNGFPHFTYFKYWFAHAGVVVFMLYATFVYNHRPTFKSVFKSFFALQIYIVLIYFINLIFKSNYFYINAKPDATTLLDLFGDWPYYILVAELILIPLFILIYLPFYLFRKRR